MSIIAACVCVNTARSGHSVSRTSTSLSGGINSHQIQTAVISSVYIPRGLYLHIVQYHVLLLIAPARSQHECIEIQRIRFPSFCVIAFYIAICFQLLNSFSATCIVVNRCTYPTTYCTPLCFSTRSFETEVVIKLKSKNGVP